MSCPSCVKAERNPRSVIYHAGCPVCSARMLANGPLFFEAERTEQLTAAYRQALQLTFGDRWQEGHAAVKQWRERIQACRQT